MTDLIEPKFTSVQFGEEELPLLRVMVDEASDVPLTIQDLETAYSASSEIFYILQLFQDAYHLSDEGLCEDFSITNEDGTRSFFKLDQENLVNYMLENSNLRDKVFDVLTRNMSYIESLIELLRLIDSNSLNINFVITEEGDKFINRLKRELPIFILAHNKLSQIANQFAEALKFKLKIRIEA